MIQIRNGVFETNISSMHCIAFSHSKGIERPETVALSLSYIGSLMESWDSESTNSIDDKASYIAYRSGDPALVAKLIKDFCGADVYAGGKLIIPSENGDCDELLPIIKHWRVPQETQSIIDFIFDKGYTIYFGNDEWDSPYWEYNYDLDEYTVPNERLISC